MESYCLVSPLNFLIAGKKGQPLAAAARYACVIIDIVFLLARARSEVSADHNYRQTANSPVEIENLNLVTLPLAPLQSHRAGSNSAAQRFLPRKSPKRTFHPAVAKSQIDWQLLIKLLFNFDFFQCSRQAINRRGAAGSRAIQRRTWTRWLLSANTSRQ